MEMNNLAESILNIEQQIKALEEQAAAQKAMMVELMKEQQVKNVIVPGSGSLTFVEEYSTSRVDTKAAQKILEEMNIAIPVTISTRKASIRCNLNV